MQMTHNNFSLEDDLLRPLKAFILKLQKETSEAVKEESNGIRSQGLRLSRMNEKKEIPILFLLNKYRKKHTW